MSKITDLFFTKEKELEKYEVPKKPSHFDIYNKLVRKEDADKYKRYFNGYLFINQLSFNNKTLPFSVMLNSSPLDEEQIFEVAKEILPKVGYLKFIKKDKEDKDLECIKWYFKVNTETAKRYKTMLTKDELKKLKTLFEENKDLT